MNTRNWIWFTILLLAVALFSGMSALELRAEEPRRAVIAMEMLLSGDYILPKIYGWDYYNKPPLFNWILIFFFKITGSFSEWVVRLPGLLFLIGTAVFNYLFVKKYLSREVALLSSLFLLTAVDLLFYGAVNSGEIDLFLVFLVYVQAASIFHFYQRKRWFWLFALSWVFTGLAFLTKGLPAVVFQVLTLGGWFLGKGELRRLFDWRHFAGFLFFVLPVGGFFRACAEHGGEAVFYLQNLLKDATRKSAVEGGWLDILAHLAGFPFQVLMILLPWSLLLFFGFKKGVFERLKARPLLFFSLVFICANIWIYWISPDARNRYLYPFFPFFALLFAWLAVEFSGRRIAVFIGIAALLAVLRIGYNFILMPLQQEKLNSGLIYRDISAEILKITQNQPVLLTGTPDTLRLNFPFFENKTILQPPLVPYQLPYYLSKSNGSIMRYEQQPRSGIFYLCFKDFAAGLPAAQALFTFTERWTGREMVLVKVGE